MVTSRAGCSCRPEPPFRWNRLATSCVDRVLEHWVRGRGPRAGIAWGENVATRVLGARFVMGDRRAIVALGLAAPARVWQLERLRLVDGHPMSLQRSFLPTRVGEEVMRADLVTTPLRQALEFKLGITITRARETVSAVRLGRREARELSCH